MRRQDAWVIWKAGRGFYRTKAAGYCYLHEAWLVDEDTARSYEEQDTPHGIEGDSPTHAYPRAVRYMDAIKATSNPCRLERLEKDAARMAMAVDAAQQILWMAERYAEAGGDSGPEMRDYNEVADIIAAQQGIKT